MISKPFPRRAALIEPCEPRRLLSTDVLTYHNDLARDGANTSETQLTLSNVNPSAFGKKFQLSVDGQLYAQPLVVSGLAFTRGKLPTIHRNMVYVATENDTVYAFDADRGQLIWSVRTLGTSMGETPIPAVDTGSDDLTPQIGITSTPVIDRSNDTIYVVAQAKRGSSTYITRLYALDLLTGAKLDGGPAIIRASVSGTGSGVSNGTISFQSLIENQRSALTLVNGVVYMGFASHGDLGPYHGWVLGYDENTLQQAAVWNDTPAGVEGGIWQSGGGFAADSAGNLFIATGNGDFNADTAGPNYSDSLVKISTTSGPFTPSDSFTPFNQADLQGGDLDFGSTGVLLLPDDVTPVPEALVGGKEGKIYVVDQDNLGGFGNGVDNIIQTIQPSNGQGGGFDTFSYFNGNVYYASSHGTLESFSVQNDGTLAPNQNNGENISFPGANPSISANGTSNGIVWYIDHTSGQAVLRAYAADDLSHQIYASNLSGKRDRAGSYVKFSTPTIANGKVFVAAADQLDIYGLL
jgi:PQQ-like domain